MVELVEKICCRLFEKGRRGAMKLRKFLPLYLDSGAPEKYQDVFNTGLWYDKFCNMWTKKGKNWTLESGKTDWINQIGEKKIGLPALLEEFVDRLGRMVIALQGEVRCFTTDWRFVTGLGREHPVENGFVWHHVLGVPYLPGSSVKGVVRAWAEQWAGVDNADVLRIFGPPATISEKSAGSVIFFDALPAGPVKVQADVMTPHYAPYYQSQGLSQPPGDWFDPVPIPFLTVAPGQSFVFAIAPRRPGHPEDRQDCALALKWLEEALAGIGAGAKTAVGYGRFKRRRELELEWRKRWPAQQPTSVENKADLVGSDAFPLETLSPIRAEMEGDGYSSDPDRFMYALTTKWLSRMQDTNVAVADRREIAQLLAEWYQKNKPDQWQKPNRKNAAKIARIKEILEGGEGY
jgi:CRISPR-associated protein Cmr6